MPSFPNLTFREAMAQGEAYYNGKRPCSSCGDTRRFKLIASTYCCYTCYSGETFEVDKTITPASIKKELNKHNKKVMAAKSKLGFIPKTYSGLNM